MADNYAYGWQVRLKDFVLAHRYLGGEEKEKERYVREFLNPSMHEANCGWDKVDYCVCEDGEDHKEYVLMYAEEHDNPNDARWIDVTGMSKGYLSAIVWSLVFA